MEKIYIHILSEFDTIYKLIENEKQLISVNTTESLNDSIDLELISPLMFDVFVYPIIKKEGILFPYSARFKFDNDNLTCENGYVKIYKLPENNYILKFLPFSLNKQELTGDKLELNDLEIKKLSFLNDLAGRAKVEVLKVDDKKIIKESEYYVYVNEQIGSELNPDLILLAFFEAYLAKDFNICFSYLSDNYASNLNKEGLKEFFGEFTSCLLVNYYSYPSIVLFYKNRAVAYSANIKENKIFDIYEIN